MKTWLGPMLGDMAQGIYHVGSTAVPGLAAKPEIDVLAIVKDFDGVPTWIASLATKGFRRGGDLSPGHLFFKRDMDGLRTHKLHICTAGHPTASRMIRFRDHLRSCPIDRDRYAAHKLALEADNKFGIAEYLAGKAPFIDTILSNDTNARAGDY